MSAQASRTTKSIVHFVLLLSVTDAFGLDAKDFERRVMESGRIHEAASPRESFDMSMRGQLDKANALLEAAVPDERKDGVDHFVIGNMLYRVDPEKSFQYHKRAYDALPDSQFTQLELAMEYQRRNECEKAIPLYEAVSRDPQLAVKFAPLLAHCYIKVRKYAKGIAAWEIADYRQRHNEIDQVIHSVFGVRDPLAIQNELINAVRRKERDKIPELLQIGVEWRTDWWNLKLNTLALQIDVDVIGETFGARSIEAIEAQALLDVARASRSGKVELEAALKKSGYLLGKKLPKSSLVAKRMLGFAIDEQLITASEFESRFGDELRRRMALRDLYAADLLAWAYVTMKDHSRLEKVDLFGWKELNMANYALSYIVGRAVQRSLTPEIVAQAAADFPEYSPILYQHYRFVKQRGGDSVSALATVIENEYKGLKNHPLQFCGALNSLYGELADLLAVQPQ